MNFVQSLLKPACISCEMVVHMGRTAQTLQYHDVSAELMRKKPKCENQVTDCNDAKDRVGFIALDITLLAPSITI